MKNNFNLITYYICVFVLIVYYLKGDIEPTDSHHWEQGMDLCCNHLPSVILHL